MRFIGTVTGGLGQGAGYVARYNSHFKRLLGMECYPGTLNIRTKEIVRLSGGIEIDPKERPLQPVHCYKVMINDAVPGYVVVPTVNRHGDSILELMAAQRLRERFQLKDGDEVTCESA